MSADLRNLLERAAGSPRRPLDVDAAVRRGTRLRRRQRVGRLASVAVLGAAVGSVAVSALSTPGAQHIPAIGNDQATAGFDPASFTDEDDERTGLAPWYMTRGGFEARVDDAHAMCQWARQTRDIETELRPYGGDGLPVVVMDYCGMGHRPEDGSPLPAGTSSVWGEYKFDCSRYAHRWQGAEWEKQTPTEACLAGQFGTSRVPPEQWAYPEAMAEHYPDVYAEHRPAGTVDNGPPTHIGSASGVRQITLSDPASCDWIIDELGGVDQLGRVQTDPVTGDTFISPNRDAIQAAVASVGAATNDGTIGGLANRCHPQGNVDDVRTAGDRS